MKKIIAFCILTLLVIVLLEVTVFAHPGRTDGDGGHTDNGSGEYHYHHGYSAHDHWDMDGDGDIDCPYEFDDKTDHNSNNNSNSGANTTPGSKPNNNATHQKHGNDKTYSYIAIGFVIAFFVIVNWLAIRIDKEDKSHRDEPISIPSILISILSTVIVFVLLFGIMFLYKHPIQLRVISFTEMLQVLFFSALLSGIVWLFANWASSLLNTLICTLTKTELIGWAGCFQRLTIPLSYAMTVLLFILQ